MTRIKVVDLPPLQDASRIEERLMATLRRLRDLPRPVSWANREDEDDTAPQVKGKPVSYEDSQKIRRRAAFLAARQAANAGIQHL